MTLDYFKSSEYLCNIWHAGMLRNLACDVFMLLYLYL